MPFYSFILVCYNNWSMTKQAVGTLLESLVTEYTDLGVELIIVNNGSKDETFDELHKFKENNIGHVEIILENIAENMGYIVGLNTGLSKANGQIITVLNNDLVFPKGWFNGLIKALENDCSLGAAVPYLSYASGIQHAGAYLNSIEEIQDYFNKFTHEHKGSITCTNRVISACLSIKREVLDLVGGFDSWFGLGQYDDDDWCMRAMAAGYKIGVIGDSFVHHLGTVTFNQNPETNSASYSANGKKFMKKWSLKGPEYEKGSYTSRDDSIKNTPYNHQKLFFPIKYEDYKIPESFVDPNKAVKRFLLVADWTNYKSKWEKALDHFLRSFENEELCLWIPEQYFEYEEVIKKLLESLSNKENLKNFTLKIIYNTVYPTEILEFISSFDGAVSVENDYVNKFILNLAKNENIVVI